MSAKSLDQSSGDLSNIPALSIHQPWAWLIVSGFKDVENRTWRISYRGPLLIHASKTRRSCTPDRLAAIRARYGIDINLGALRLGGIIGVAELIDCVDSSPSAWSLPGHRQWLLAAAQELPFQLCKGRQGLFYLDD